MERNTKKRGKGEMHIIGLGVWRENCTSWNIRNTKYSTCIIGRKLKNVENEIQTLDDMDYGEKTEKREKWETHMVGPGICQEIDERG